MRGVRLWDGTKEGERRNDLANGFAQPQHLSTLHPDNRSVDQKTSIVTGASFCSRVTMRFVVTIEEAQKIATDCNLKLIVVEINGQRIPQLSCDGNVLLVRIHDNEVFIEDSP